MCISAEYDSNTATVNISTGNAGLDGSGPMGTVITAGGDGTTVSAVTIKATSNTSQGMVRLFVDNGIGIFLFMEIRIPANVQTGVVSAFGITVPVSLSLNSGYILKASTQNSESFNVTGYGQTWTNCSC